MVMFKGDPITLQGTLIRVGQKAPDFSVVTPDMKTLSLKDFQGKVLVISTVPSVDTIVCSLQSQRFEKEAKALSSVNFLPSFSMLCLIQFLSFIFCLRL